MTEIQIFLVPVLVSAVALIGLVWLQDHKGLQKKAVIRIVRIPLDGHRPTRGGMKFFLPNLDYKNQGQFLLIEGDEVRSLSFSPGYTRLGTLLRRELTINQL